MYCQHNLAQINNRTALLSQFLLILFVLMLEIENP